MIEDTQAAPPRRRCAACAGELRFSHREYAGRGTSSAVLRCPACGTVVRDAARPPAAPSQARRSRGRIPVDEGPPANPVLDPETVARRLGAASDDG